MSNQNQSQAWDKRANETPRSYAVFCVYRDLGAKRSIAKAVEAYRKTGGRAGVSFAEEWSVRYSWTDRVEAYDLYLEASKRLEQEAKYLAELAGYQEKQKKTSSALLGRASRVIKLIDDKLNTLTADHLTVQLIPVYLRAAASVAEAAIAIEAQALGVEEVIRHIKRQEAREKNEEE